ncbi:cobalamin biosynthesis protein CobW [Shewanella sp. Choline-02u-19]|uniref:CobW family GTP-binding protein n=1 Tax=unclassified Shewanella TaxID=196818 RepID=UPI000C343337|nr:MULTISPECIES: CobW family GTP-binding protein [unclassified Shewanella]PKG57920.1 cobalamin biosynthesis protein CobW [Shewanella sp. GutDb-MelDb]PKH54852.1 cobalamin biosynthesis protein CobW [Shewanella sp. Bg11-22]PKI26624.1 cobalamin biosynthesis protein CobW [Shewanella sp. Choline-02u-19]
MIQKIIPTNVITGFLGVGKTSFIRSLLSQKPADEVWAVLVNEFGEVGIDAGLLGGETEQIQIKEVAGGCMCCAAGLPMQVAINQLIAKAKPDRLLIEPTGLGHPQEVLKVLTQAHYQQVLAMKTCITLVDARKLSDSRYTQHDIFNQQLQVADLVLASKADCYETPLIEQLSDYITAVNNGAVTRGSNSDSNSNSSYTNAWKHRAIEPWSTKQVELLMPSIIARLNQPHEQIVNQCEIQQLNGSSFVIQQPARLLDVNYSPLFSKEAKPQDVEFDGQGIMCKTKHADGFYSCGWVFDLSYEFDFDKLLHLIKSLEVIRLKAVMITEEGIAGFNSVDSELSIVELDDAMDSRIELLSMSKIDRELIEGALLSVCSRLG